MAPLRPSLARPLWPLLRPYAAGASRGSGTRSLSSTPLPQPAAPRLFRRTASFIARAVFWTSLGFSVSLVCALYPLFTAADFDAFRRRRAGLPLADELAYVPETKEAADIEAAIAAHPVVQQLRSGASGLLVEQRPTLRMPSVTRRHNLTASTLAGPGLLAVPPLQWTDGRGRELVQIMHVGRGLCGHPGIVHGGFVATMLDEALGRCCFEALPLPLGMTAYLHIDYRAPTPADSLVKVHAKTVRVEGRKAWVEARLEALPTAGAWADGKTEPKILAEAEALFVGFRDYGLGKYIPKNVF